MKPTRYCEECGKELLWIRTASGLVPCDYDGPVPYWANKRSTRKILTRDGEFVRCELEGDPGQVTGTGYVLHRLTCKKS